MNSGIYRISVYKSEYLMTSCYHLFIFHIFTYLFLFLRVIDYFRSRLQVLFLTDNKQICFYP